MNIPKPLADELKRYLQQRADNGDIEAQRLLTQIEQVPASPLAVIQEAMYEPPPGLEMGC